MFSPSDIPAVRQDRWIWLSRFLDEWCPPARPCQRYLSDVHLDAAEHRIGNRVPSAVRQWYLQFSNRLDLWSAQDELLLPDSLTIDGELLVFLVESQGVVQWGIPVNALDSEDPRVLLDLCDLGDGLQIESASFSEFVVALALYHFKFVSSHVAAGSVQEPSTSSLIKAQLTPWHWPKFPTAFFFLDDSVVEVQGSPNETCWITLTARNQKRLDDDMKRLKSHGIELLPCR